MNVFKQPKHKRFNYTPLHLRDKKEESSYDFESQWRGGKKQPKKQSKLFILIAVLVMIIVLFYVLSGY